MTAFKFSHRPCQLPGADPEADRLGTAETLADGLEAIKSRVTVEALAAPPPDRPSWG